MLEFIFNLFSRNSDPNTNQPTTCPCCYDREIFGFFQPYCISSKREKPIILESDEDNPGSLRLYNSLCNTTDFKSCQYYSRERLEPPKSPKDSDFNKEGFVARRI